MAVNALSMRMGTIPSRSQARSGALATFLRSVDFTCQGLEVAGGAITIDRARATGYYWNPQGERSEVVAFPDVGDYRLYVADNLETETEGSASLVKHVSNDEAHLFSPGGTCRTTPSLNE